MTDCATLTWIVKPPLSLPTPSTFWRKKQSLLAFTSGCGPSAARAANDVGQHAAGFREKIMYLAAPIKPRCTTTAARWMWLSLTLTAKRTWHGYRLWWLWPSFKTLLWMDLFKDSTLSKTAYENRLLLRTIMKRAGLRPITSEWWHFSTCTKEEAALKFKLIK